MHSGAACANGPGRLRGLPTPKTWREASRIGDFVDHIGRSWDADQTNGRGAWDEFRNDLIGAA